MTFYLRELAATYHSYYDAERILVDDEPCEARALALVAATAQVLHNGLAVLGVGAPGRCNVEARISAVKTDSEAAFLIVGIIIGVVLGLAAALAVAVYVTKVPIPFLNRGQSRTAEQDAAEVAQEPRLGPQRAAVRQEPGQGRAARARHPSPRRCRPRGTVPVPPTPCRRPASAASRPPRPAWPIRAASLAAARSTQRRRSVPLFRPGRRFRTPEDAEAQRAKLSLMGVEAKVTEREQSGRAGVPRAGRPLRQEGRRRPQKERLEAGGVETALVRVQR